MTTAAFFGELGAGDETECFFLAAAGRGRGEVRGCDA
jgi:hypothetical protein